MKVVILQSNYIPWKGYFDLINDADIFVFYDEVKYTKNDWRNRNRIFTKNGLQWLTIPINKDAVKQRISEVLLPDNSWQELHFKSLELGYKSALYYSQLERLMDRIYIAQKWKNLSEMNQSIVKEISDYLGIRTRFVDSKSLDLKGDRIDRLINILKQLNATEYISGPTAKVYIEEYEHLFSKNNIKLVYKNYAGYPEYEQLSKPFEHSVSIFDLIANVKIDVIKKYIWEWRIVS